MFKRVLVANRGEIACRIIRTLQRLGIGSIAVYSTADADSLHVRMADEAYCIGEPRALESYLHGARIVETALACGAEAIHPGYGFLSENPAFARQVSEAGLIFIGPPVAAMEAMASKQVAKQLLEGSGVPLTPGYHGAQQGDAVLLEAARKTGFPVLIKAAAGGGGKGMRAVHHEAEFADALAGARREATASFGNDTMLIEKLIENPRHVEIQIMADNHGQTVHLFERDCSIQRRHQKIIEEAPAPNLPDTLRQGLAKAACDVARIIDYRGAGTVEFLVDGDRDFYFMEVNTRLQVEHPVTEMITGLDLVEWQLRIAANEPLPLAQDAIQQHGHAIECRLCAEDPGEHFLPSTGTLHFLMEPAGEGIRVDSGVVQGSGISQYYDPMFAKLIAWGKTREEALSKLRYALAHFHVGGVRTNIPFLAAILTIPDFANATHTTRFLTEHAITIPSPTTDFLVLAAAGCDYLALLSGKSLLEKDSFGWHMGQRLSWPVRYQTGGHVVEARIRPCDADTLEVTLQGVQHILRAHRDGNRLRLSMDGVTHTLPAEYHAGQWIFYTERGPAAVAQLDWHQTESLVPESGLTAPMPSTVVAILKNIGDRVAAGERLLVLEAMKMEHTLHAPHDGILSAVFYPPGSQVAEGAELLALDAGHRDTAEE